MVSAFVLAAALWLNPPSDFELQASSPVAHAPVDPCEECTPLGKDPRGETRELPRALPPSDVGKDPTLSMGVSCVLEDQWRCYLWEVV